MIYPFAVVSLYTLKEFIKKKRDEGLNQKYFYFCINKNFFQWFRLKLAKHKSWNYLTQSRFVHDNPLLKGKIQATTGAGFNLTIKKNYVIWGGVRPNPDLFMTCACSKKGVGVDQPIHFLLLLYFFVFFPMFVQVAGSAGPSSVLPAPLAPPPSGCRLHSALLECGGSSGHDMASVQQVLLTHHMLNKFILQMKTCHACVNTSL